MDHEQRINMKFCFKLHKSAKETHEMLKLVYGDAAVTMKTVYKRFERFRNGCESAEDEERSGRSSAAKIQENVERVSEMIRSNRRLTIRESSEDLNISYGSVQNILTADLKMRRVRNLFHVFRRSNKSMWGHPHVIPCPIKSHFTSQFSFLCPDTNQHSDLVNSSLTTTANHSFTPSFSVYFHKQRKRPLTSGTTFWKPRPSALPTSQWKNRLTSSDLYKRSYYSERSNCPQHIEKEVLQDTSRQETRLPGHDASWTGHTTAHPGIQQAADGQQLHRPLAAEVYRGPHLTSTAVHSAVHHHPRLTGRFSTSHHRDADRADQSLPIRQV